MCIFDQSRECGQSPSLQLVDLGCEVEEQLFNLCGGRLGPGQCQQITGERSVRADVASIDQFVEDAHGVTGGG